MRNFKELKIWQTGFQISLNCYKIIKAFPREEVYGLSVQITKAAVSIPANIAEGSGRTTPMDYCRFIRISLGSAFELETHLLIAQALNYGEQALISATLKLLTEEEKMLTAFEASLLR